MSVLRDIRQEKDFNEASFHLLKSIKSGQDLTLERLKSHIAKAIGARNIQALRATWKHEDHTKIRTCEVGSPLSGGVSDYWDKAINEWCVVTCLVPNKDGSGYVHLALCGDLGSKSEPECFTENFEEDPSTEEDFAEIFYSALSNEIAIVKMDNQFNYPLPALAKPGSAQIMRLNDYLPELFSLLMAGEDDIEELLFDPKTPLISIANRLGFTYEHYLSERDELNTSLSYSAWVSHQLESWKDDVTAHL